MTQFVAIVLVPEELLMDIAIDMDTRLDIPEDIEGESGSYLSMC